MANLRADNLTGTGGRNAIDGSVFFELGDRLQVPSSTYSTNFNLGGDFTIEGWIKPSIFTSYPAILHLDDSTNSKDLYINFRNGATLGITNDSTVFATSPSFTLNEWAHFAVVRNSNSVTVYCNGVGGSSASCTTDFGAGNQNLYIGMISALSASDRYRGYMSNLRIVKGSALYTANFTPPTEKLTIIPNTVLLCCQDSDDSIQEATGKTITAYGNLDYSLRDYNLITNGNFDSSTVTGWTLASGSRSLGTGQSGTFGDGNHLVLTGGSMYQAFTTVIGRTYFVNAQSNGGDSSYISTSTSTGDAIITDIRSNPQTGSGVRGQKSFVATQTTYYVILAGGGTGNFDTVSVYESESPKAPKVLPPVGIDEGVVFDGDTKVNTQSYMYFPTGDTSQRGRGRGFRFGGDSPNKANYIEYVNIQSQGTAQDFGDLLTTLTQAHGGSSSIRTIIFAGYNAPANVADIQYFTNATQGNSIDAGINVGGDFTRYCNVVSSETRSVYGGGTPGYTATMEYVTNASLGSVADFADFVQGGMYSAGTMNSTTRGLFAGGYYASPVGQSTRIQYITIATTADSIAFGDLTQVMGGPHGICSSPTRGIMWDGGNTIDYVTIATLGDGVDFGEASVDGFNSGVSFSSHTRACAGGGYNQNSPGSGGNANQNYIDFVQIATTGNAKDFGDLNTVGSSMGGSSDCHGGLS